MVQAVDVSDKDRESISIYTVVRRGEMDGVNHPVCKERNMYYTQSQFHHEGISTYQQSENTKSGDVQEWEGNIQIPEPDTGGEAR